GTSARQGNRAVRHDENEDDERGYWQGPQARQHDAPFTRTVNQPSVRDQPRNDQVREPARHAAESDGDENDGEVAAPFAAEPSPVPLAREGGEEYRLRAVGTEMRGVIRVDRQTRHDQERAQRTALAIFGLRELEHERHRRQRENERHEARAPLVHAE